MRQYQIQFNQFSDVSFIKVKGITFVFVLHGQLSCIVNNIDHTLNAGEIILLNHGDSVLFNHCSGDVMSFNIHQQLLDDIIDDYAVFNLQNASNVLSHFKNLLAKIGIVYLRKSKYYKLFIEQQTMEILTLLIPYASYRDTHTHAQEVQDIRLDRVCRYIDTHYDEVITLQDMAELVDLSPAYLSKLFTRKLNIGFNHYVNELRLEHVVFDLIHTDDSIIDIAIQNGFSSSALLSRAFKKWSGLSPSEYRNQHKVQQQNYISNDISERDLIIRLSPYVTSDERQLMQTPEMGRDIEIQFSESEHVLHHYHHIIQVGKMDALLIEQVQQQLMTCKKDIGVSHVLVKDIIESPHIISEEVTTDERIANLQRYNKVDACLDFLTKHRLGLIITVHPTSDITNYLQQMSELLKHITMRINAKEDINIKLYIKQMCFKDYLRIIERVASYIPGIQVFAHLDVDAPGEMVHIIKHAHFVEEVVFDANQNDIINFESTDDNIFKHAKHHIVDKTKKVRDFLSNHQIQKPLILLNWNTLTGDTHLTNGEYFRGGIIFEQFLQLNTMIDTIGYWLNYDLHIHNALSKHDYMNSIELFHQYNGKRPAFFTSHLFRKILPNVMFKTDNCLVVGQPEHFQVIIYDAEHFNPYLTLNNALPFLENKDVAIKIKDIASGTYRIKHYTLDKAHGALYQVWQSYNTQSGIDAESIEYINRVSYPELRVSDQVVQQEFQYHIKLLTNAIHLIDIKQYVE